MAISRTAKLKLGYVAAVVVIGAICAVVAYLAEFQPMAMILTGIVLLIPGRIAGYYWRDQFRGRRLMAEHRYDESLAASNAFLRQVREEHWRKRLLWLMWSFYTTDAEAMALNNIGAAHVELGEWELARTAFQDALAVDQLYPIPHFNLAMLSHLEGDEE